LSQAWKVDERQFARQLQSGAGRVQHAPYTSMVSPTGRVGHITELGFDILVGNPEHGTDLAAESKRRKTFLGADAKRALYQVVSKAFEYGRKPTMCYALTEGDDLWVPVAGGPKARKARMIRRWVMMPLDFVEELLRYRRIVAILRDNPYFNAMWEGAWMEDQLADVTVASEQEEVSDGV